MFCALQFQIVLFISGGLYFAVFVSLLVPVFGVENDVEIVGGRNGLEALRVKLESEIDDFKK